jgi:predicted Ser/Thr protein kinase
MSAPVICPKCGAAVPSDAPKGLCPRCLGAMNFATETALTGDDALAAQPPLSPVELAPHFPQLEIIQYLGRGGMGVVYQARQKTLNRMVALKLLAPERVADATFAQRFTHEAQALAALNHPGIVTIYDFGQAGGFYFLLMEFVDGVNLRQAMKAGRFTPEQALAIVPPVCEALQYAHEHGIVHRDIKPENLLLDKQGRVKIADFGIAKMLGGEAASPPADRTPTESAGQGASLASAAGTPQYMSPEQKAHRTTDHRADIYSLGVVLYELLTGELPADKLQPPSRRVQVDVRLDEIVLRALEAKPELRYQTAGEFRTQLEAMTSSPDTAGSRSKLAYAAMSFAGLSGLLGAVAFRFWPVSSPLLVGAILGSALLGIGLAIPVRRLALGKTALVVGAVNTAIWVVVSLFWLTQTSTPPTISATTPAVSYRTALLPKEQLVKSEAALKKLQAEVAIQEATVKAGSAEAARLQVTKRRVAALEAELNGFIAVWNPFEELISQHQTTGVLPARFREAQNAVGTGEARLRVIQAIAEHGAQGANFGPVAERLVPANDQSPWPWFDIDAGTAVVALRGEDHDRADFATQMQSGSRGLSTADETGFGSIPLEAIQWDTLTPDKLLEKLTRATADPLSGEGPLPKTYGFTTRSGGLGLLQITGHGASPPGIKIRYKMVPSVDTYAAHKPPAAPLVFGPVIERVLPSGVPCREQYFQFRSGTVFVIGNGPGTSKEEAAYDEKRIDDAGGVDMSAGSSEDRIHISGRGCIFTRDVHELKWGSITAEQAVRALQRVRDVDGVVTPMKKELPVTYLFKTARDEIGLLEVLGVEDQQQDGWKEKGVRFRYQLVKGTGTTPPVATAKSSLIFGPEEKGLRAALEVTPGEPFKVRIVIRNVSERGISLDGALYRQADECLLADGQGRPVPVTTVPHDIRIGMKGGYFGPGQVAVFESAGLSFQELAKAPSSAGYVAQAKPGRHTLRFRLRLPGDDVPFAPEKSVWRGELETGPVTIDVKDPATQPMEPVADAIWSSVLGPAVERVVNDFQSTREQSALSFDTGKLVPVPATITLATLTDPSGQPAALAWARDQQVDALAFVTMEGGKLVKCGLLCPGLVVIRANNKEWNPNEATPRDLKEKFEEAMREWKEIPHIAEVTTGDDFPANYLILDTRTHRRGVLQILGVADQPRGVKIRYRLVEGAAVTQKKPDPRASSPFLSVKRDNSSPLTSSIISSDSGPEAIAKAQQLGIAAATRDIQAGNFRILAYGLAKIMPGDADQETGYRLQSVAGTILSSVFQAECDAYNFAMREHYQKYVRWQTPGLGVPAAKNR